MSKEAKIEKLLDLVEWITEIPGLTWDERHQMILDQATSDDRTNLEEFASWFE